MTCWEAGSVDGWRGSLAVPGDHLHIWLGHDRVDTEVVLRGALRGLSLLVIRHRFFVWGKVVGLLTVSPTVIARPRERDNLPEDVSLLRVPFNLYSFNHESREPQLHMLTEGGSGSGWSGRLWGSCTTTRMRGC